MKPVRRVWLAVAGGMVGALLRYITVADGSGVRLTLIGVNVVGALSAGWLVGRVPHHSHRARWLLPLGVVGVAGALTTFSTLALDTVLLLDAGRWSEALWLAALSLVSGPVAASVGLSIGSRP